MSEANAMSTEYMLRELQAGGPEDGEIYIKDVLVRFDLIQGQIDKLAKFITDKVPGNPLPNEGTVDCAIRVLGDLILTSHILVSKSDARKILSALRQADQFFQARDKMNSHLHLATPVSSPLAAKVTFEHRRLEAKLVELDAVAETPGQASGS